VADETLEVLKSIDRKLSAVVALLAEQALRTAEPSKTRARNLDRTLTDQGLTGAQVARLLGKSPQAVSQALLRQRKAADSPGSRSARTAGSGEQEGASNGR